MANEPTKAEPTPVEQRLKSLYDLQTILSEIDRIRTVRGELPLEVKDLEDNIEGLTVRLENYNNELKTLKASLAAEKNKVHEAQALIERYQKQLNDVRNNKEFDTLSKEIEFQTLEIELASKHTMDWTRDIEAKTADIAHTQEALDDNRHILAEKKQELDEIVGETRDQEEKLWARAKELEPLIDERTLNAFKRIRGNARNGLGIVYVQRNACGGCFNRIPPQRQIEIKRHKRVIVCEYCGRILIDPELAGVETNEK